MREIPPISIGGESKKVQAVLNGSEIQIDFNNLCSSQLTLLLDHTKPYTLSRSLNYQQKLRECAQSEMEYIYQLIIGFLFFFSCLKYLNSHSHLIYQPHSVLSAWSSCFMSLFTFLTKPRTHTDTPHIQKQLLIPPKSK